MYECVFGYLLKAIGASGCCHFLWCSCTSSDFTESDQPACTPSQGNKALGVASGMPLVMGRAEIGRVAMRWASEGETKKWGSRFESLAGSRFFDSSSPWAQAERSLKEDYWPLARGRDEDAGGEMARMLLARAASADVFSAVSMGRLARARMEALSMFAGECDWIGAGADMIKAVGKRFLSAKKIGQSEFDAYPELAWLGARSASGHDSALGSWVGDKLQKKEQESENYRDKLAAVELLRFDLEALSRFESAFPGILESRAAHGAGMLFGEVRDRRAQIYRVDSALGRPSGKWARSAFGAGGSLSDGELDQAWSRLVKAIPAVCALWQAAELKKAAGEVKKAGKKRVAPL